MVPPRSKIFVGDGDFEKIGFEFFNYFLSLCSLKPGASVLEVGSGVGRMAIPLTGYLKYGRYEGIDIVPAGIKWCRENITKKFANFNFIHADIKNKLYNPKGKINAENFKFPFPDESFDFVFLTSVFTHMLPKEVENYIVEISRTMKKKGNALITFFLLNSHSISYVNTKGNRFCGKIENHRIIDPNIPEAAIAFEEDYIKTLLKRNRLKIEDPIYYGSWCKREDSLSAQDILIVKKI